MLLYLTLLLLALEDGTLLLEDAIALALERNRDLQGALLNLGNSETRLDLQHETFRWQFGSGLAASDGDDSTRTVTFNTTVDKQTRLGTNLGLTASTDLSDTADERYQTDYTLSIQQPLSFRAGPLYNERGLRSAERSLESSRESLRTTRQGVIFRVVQAYYQALFQVKLISISEKSLKRVEGLVEATTIKLNIGRVSQVDLYRARLLRNRTDLDLSRAQTDLLRFYRSLGDLMGVALEEEYRLVTPTITLPQTEALDIDRLLAVYPSLISVRRLERDRREAEIDVVLAKREMWPDLNLNVNMYMDRVDDVFGFDGEKDRGITVSLSNNYTFNRKTARAARYFAENRLKQLELNEVDLRIAFEREVLDRVQNLVFMERQLELSRTSLAFAEQQVEVARIRFERGLIDNFDVIEAEENYLSAANEQERAQRDLILQWLNLKIYLNLLDPDRIELERLLFL